MDRPRENRIGRNDPCHCGSGKKFKRCHGQLSAEPRPSLTGSPYPGPIPPEVLQAIEQHKADELRRESQQGLGKPIIGAQLAGYQLVAVGNTVHWGKYKTFFDFLGNYIRQVLGAEWGNQEIAKPLAERHPILRWYDAVCELQRQHNVESGKVSSVPMTGAAAAFFGLAYSLYLLAHNVKLQQTLIGRLKNPDQFHGAYYETLVASWFILAGFELSLENEADGAHTHCEFTAVHKASGKSYSVEAKSRAPGKTHLDVGNQLAKALRKEAAHPRIVMIDVNVPYDPAMTEDVWLRELMRSIKGREATLTIDGQPAPPAFVIVTNHPFHYDLQSSETALAALAEGFKIPDFGRSVPFDGLIAAFKAKKKYQDLFNLVQTIGKHQIPTTFDGEVPEFAFGHAERRWKIGERYDLGNFPDMSKGASGVLTSAVVLEGSKAAALRFYIEEENRSVLFQEPMTDAELAAYRAHPETYFVVHRDVGGNLKTPLDMFEWLHKNYSKTSRAKLLEFLKDAPDIGELSKLPDAELLLVYCDRMTGGVLSKANNASPSQPGGAIVPPAS
jgi:hypothetical protein